MCFEIKIHLHNLISKLNIYRVKILLRSNKILHVFVF